MNLIGQRKDAHPSTCSRSRWSELAADRPIDHVVITGDLTNLALESEFARARAILEPLAGKLSVIPGNHDVYTRGAQKSRRFEQHFGDWMWGADAQTDPTSATYPWLKDFGDVALVGFSSAVARMPFIATGHVSAAQIERLAAMHWEGALEGRFAVALVHHNLHARGFRKDTMHGLANRDDFVSALARAGVRLLLHGHTHVSNRFEQDGVAIVGSGSSTWSSLVPEHVGRYNVYELGRDGLRSAEVRRWSESEKRFVASHSETTTRAADLETMSKVQRPLSQTDSRAMGRLDLGARRRCRRVHGVSVYQAGT